MWPRLLLMMFLLAVSGMAQAPTPPDPTPTDPYLPQYFIGSGVAYDYYGRGSNFAPVQDPATPVPLSVKLSSIAAVTTVGVRLSKSPVFSHTTLEMTPSQAVLRTGLAYVFHTSGYWSLTALGDAGLAAGSGPYLSSYSGGGFIGYDVGGKLTKGRDHFYIMVGGKVVAITSQIVQPVITVEFAKGF